MTLKIIFNFLFFSDDSIPPPLPPHGAQNGEYRPPVPPHRNIGVTAALNNGNGTQGSQRVS